MNLHSLDLAVQEVSVLKIELFNNYMYMPTTSWLEVHHIYIIHHEALW